MSSPSFEYTILSVADLQVATETNQKTGRKTVKSVSVNDEPMLPTERYWTSLFARFGFNSSMFKYYDHDEVFQRISEREPQDRMRICVERDANGQGTLLAVSNPTKPVVAYDDLMDMLGRYSAENVSYTNGIVESWHTPRVGANIFQIGGDDFANRFVMGTAIDGYGTPNIYLSLVRLACNNGAIGMAKGFRSQISLGKGGDDVAPSITRALDGFNSDEGYAALRDRFSSAAKSWASVNETQVLYKLLIKLHSKKQISFGSTGTKGGIITKILSAPSHGVSIGDPVGSPVLTAYHRLCGDVSQIYGLANLEALSIKRQKTLPTKAHVYSLLNFATEVASHHSAPDGARALQAYVGALLSEEYDLENSVEKYGEFDDFMIERKLEASAELHEVGA